MKAALTLVLLLGLLSLAQSSAQTTRDGPRPAFPTERTVLRAQPSAFSSCGAESCNREPLSDAEAREVGVRIVKRDGAYFWASRNGRRLHHEVSGYFHLFIDLRGRGYVKVLDQRAGPKGGHRPHSGTDLQYYEHLAVLRTSHNRHEP